MFVLYDKIRNDFLALLMVLAVAVMIGSGLARFIESLGVNSTDSAEHSRSGLEVRIDNLTGCHYLESKNGYLTLRLDKTGDQICTGQE